MEAKKTIDINTAIEKVSKAEAITEPRDNRKMKIGEVAHQGDVYVCRVKEHADIYKLNKLIANTRPRNWISTPNQIGDATTERQVAPGNTLGSRHVANGPGLKLWSPPPGASPLEGPTIESEGEWRLDHPEHAPHIFGAGMFVVTYQMDVNKEKEIRRVTD